ncbi:diacylglycerol kinase family protein [Microbacterium sp. ET2]|uniref:diacylglycerol/lipid kinase family protein n=1 Tax=Microbacterium albipurpureum TaxID=3050384 RepID=UPI00259D0446|nr:diacylglycerol kinase family protein [Microbacterium sp. ET2 (Ac-2212)]WJL96661.1 diacylglycerol kinase family protein [Microbacterium sp. ET2 (Ac-2212)]
MPGGQNDNDEAPDRADPPHPSDAVYSDGPDEPELEAADEELGEQAEEIADGDLSPGDVLQGDLLDDEVMDSGESADAPDATGAAEDAPDPAEAAAPDDVIREPDDVEPDTTDGEEGEARRVSAEGEPEPMADTEGRPSPKAALVYNPTKVDADDLRARVERAAKDAGWSEPLFYETTVDDLGDDVTRQALKEGVNAVLVAGGDGTVRAVAEAMTGTGVPLTIVPSGTGNLLARNLLLPLDDPDAMIRATFDGDSLAMDVGFASLRRQDGTVDEHAFVVMGGMGLDAAMIANTNPKLKKQVGWVAYVDGVARSLPAAKPFRLMYQLPQRRIHAARVQSVLFANCGSLPAGLELIPEASVADGNLDIVFLQPKGLLGWIFVWRRVAWDNSFLRRFRSGRRVMALRTKDNAVRYSRGLGVDLATSEPHPVQLDGDEFGEAAQVRVRLEPASLLLALPRGHEVEGL